MISNSWKRVILLSYQSERITQINKFRKLNWTAEQEDKLSVAFLLIDEVMYECEKANKSREVRSLALARFTIEPLVTAFSFRKIGSDLHNEQ